MPARKAKACIPDIAKSLRDTGLTHSLRDAEEILKTAFKIIRNKLEDGQNVYLDGFGTFSANHHKERLVHDIHNGPQNKVKAGLFVSFKAAGGNRLTTED